MKRPVVIAIIAAILIAGAVALNLTLQKPEVRTASPASRTAQVPAAVKPSFDVVRIDAQGNTVMAGRAAPGATVVILDGATELGRVTADGRGEWVFTPDKPLPPGNRELSLSVTDPAGKILVSDNIVVMSVPERGGEVLIVEQARQGGRSRVLQGKDAAPGLQALTVDALDYDEQGRITLGGKADPGSRVQVYLDNKPIGTVEADARGTWQLTPDAKAAEGRHSVRADEIGANETVLARVEVPFNVSHDDGMAPNTGSVTIVRGNSLWRIARRIYGKGTMYTVIFDANKENIKDPNLIYPEQVFRTPKEGS